MKAEESVTNYFSYVKNVLGVRTIQSAKIYEAMNATPTVDLLFLNLKDASGPSALSGEARELLDKMIAAMKLGSKSFDVQESNAAHFSRTSIGELKSPFVILFTDKPEKNGLIQNLGTHKYMETFSPAYLLKNPGAKKVAWGDLQKVMKEIGVL